MIKLSFKKLMFTIKYSLPIAAKVVIVLWAACVVLFVSYKIHEAREDDYIQQIRVLANTGERFTLKQIFGFKWDEAVYMYGPYDDGLTVRERYGSDYKIWPSLNDFVNLIAFFENGKCVFEFRNSSYSEISFRLYSGIITQNTQFVATTKDNSNLIRLQEIGNDEQDNKLILDSIREKNRIIKMLRPYIIGGILILVIVYLSFFLRNDKCKNNKKRKMCADCLFLCAAKGKPFTLAQATNGIQWDEAKLFTHSCHTCAENNPEADYYFVINPTSNEARETLVLFKDKKYVFDFSFNKYDDFIFADSFETLSADTLLTATKQDDYDGYILSIK